MARPSLCIVTAVPMSLEAFWPPLLSRAQADFDLSVVASGADSALVERLGIHATPIDVPIPRRPSPFADWRALRALTRIFARERFDIVHSQTPKAGLLAMSAARRAGVPVRVHTFTGQVWATQRGAWRTALKHFDCRTARAATALLADSASQARFLVDQGVVSAARITTLHHGSMSGVDARRFRPDADSRAEVRRTYRTPEHAIVLLFVGRLQRDKGIGELLQAFAHLASGRPMLRLWLVGPDEGAGAAVASLPSAVRSAVVVTGLTRAPERCMAAADLLVLPSHREGFGNVVIEAAACGIPAAASRIPGLVDAVVDGETGLLHQVGSVDALEQALTTLIDDGGLRRRLGEAALQRARRDFDPVTIADALVRFYHAQREHSRAAATR